VDDAFGGMLKIAVVSKFEAVLEFALRRTEE
jgi:hypothetical protein